MQGKAEAGAESRWEGRVLCQALGSHLLLDRKSLGLGLPRYRADHRVSCRIDILPDFQHRLLCRTSANDCTRLCPARLWTG